VVSQFGATEKARVRAYSASVFGQVLGCCNMAQRNLVHVGPGGKMVVEGMGAPMNLVEKKERSLDAVKNQQCARNLLFLA
jgi:hypothetical protein